MAWDKSKHPSMESRPTIGGAGGEAVRFMMMQEASSFLRFSKREDCARQKRLID